MTTPEIRQQIDARLDDLYERHRSRAEDSGARYYTAGRGYGPPVLNQAGYSLLSGGRTADAIVDPYNAPPLMDLIKEGEYYKMQTFDQHLVELFKQELPPALRQVRTHFK